jgi:plasmid stabilization system protein ParE
MKIEWTEPAVTDLEMVRDYIAKDSGFYALRFVERVFELLEPDTNTPESRGAFSNRGRIGSPSAPDRSQSQPSGDERDKRIYPGDTCAV